MVLAGEPPALPHDDDQFITDTLQLADWHGVTALIHHELSVDNRLEKYPHAFIQQLTARNNRIVAGKLLWKQEMINVQKSLRSAKIRSLLIKGFPLSYILYPAPHLRLYSDIDILFPDFETTEKAWNTLANMGYTRPVTTSGKYISHQFSCYRSGASGFPFALDLHWRVNNHYFFASALTFEELDSTSMKLPGLEPEMRTLLSEYALLYACMHRIAHLPFNESNRLVWLYDIHLLAKSFNEDQWTHFVDLATMKKLSSVCLDGLLECKTRFNSALPENVLEKLRQEGTNDPVRPAELTSTWKYNLTIYKTMPGWTERLCLLREHLFPPSDYMLNKYKTNNKWLLPYLYLKRITGGLKKLFK